MWERFKDWLDSDYGMLFKIVGIVLLVFSLFLVGAYCSGMDQRTAQKICVKKCKEMGGTHGRLFLPNNGDGFFECRCFNKDFPFRSGSIFIEEDGSVNESKFNGG